MREMKDSGVEWIGEIPDNWKNLPNKYLFELSKTIVGEQSEDYQLLSLTKHGIVTKDKEDLSGKLPDSFDTYQDVEKGQLVLCLFDLDVSAVFSGLSQLNGMISPAYKVYNCSKEIYNEYAKFWFEFCFIGRKYTIYSKSLRYVVNSDDFKTIPALLPPSDEQHSIANFLNCKCAAIDVIVSNIESEIEILKTYKQSLITEVVTKGLDPDVEMKDSGVEWIDFLPENWSAAKIDSLYASRVEKVSDKDFQPLSVTMHGILPQLETVAKTDDGDNRKLVRKGDFVINSRSDRRGSCGISVYNGSVSLINTVLCPKENMNPIYYNWLFHSLLFSDEFYKHGHGIANDLWTTTWDDMKKITLPVPPTKEQADISNFLDTQCFGIDTIITEKREQLSALTNYKKTLIYEYVTGKKEAPST